MKTITLQTAVTLAINSLLDVGVVFSALDVTKTIRSLVDTEYNISDVDDRDMTDTPYTVISHKDVRSIVVELFENDLIDATKGYYKNGVVAFITYTPNVVKPLTPVAPAQPDSVDRLVAEIDAYLAANGSRTIKQIQSRMKISGLLCEDIAKVLKLDRAVIGNNYSLSKIVVDPNR